MSCSYGLSVGSIEGAAGTGGSAVDNSASCAFLGLMSPDSMGKSDENQTRVPYCRDVMPGYTAVSKTDTSVQAIYIASLIGVGILSLGLMVLAGVLLRRWHRRKADDMEQGMIKGVLPGSDTVESDRSTPTSERSNAVAASDGKGSEDGAQSTKALVPAAVVPRQPDTAREGRGKGAKIRAAAENRSQAERIKRRLAKVGDEEEEEEEGQEHPVGDADDPGAGAGVIGGSTSVRRAADLRGGAGGLVLGMGSSGRMSQTPSPGTDLYGDRRTAQSIFGRVPTPPGSAGSGSGRDSATGSRGPTPPEGRRTKRPSPRTGLAGGPESRPNSTGLVEVEVAEDGDGAAGELWEDGTGIRIDDILAEAKAASVRRDELRQPPPPPWKVSSVGTGWGGRAGTESRASSGGSKVVASGPGGVAAAGEGSGSGSGSGGGGGSPHGSAADGVDGAASHPSEAGSPGPGSVRAAAAIAPHLSARLGMTGQHALPPRAPPSHRRPVLSSLGANPPPPPPPRQQGESPAPRRTVALVQYPAGQARDLASRLGRELPRAGQAGVPPPPARPLPRAGEAGVPPPPPGRPRGRAEGAGAPATARPPLAEVRDTTASPMASSPAVGGGPGPAAGVSSAARPAGQGRDGRGMTTLRPLPGASPTSPPDAAGGF
jgi:hypothetical protein